MTGRQLGLERALLALFVASGFAGLIYQAIWSHYLGLSLGHAAYAQTLVLAIFMGGMALGAWLVSRRGARWRRLIFAYAVVEVLIGLAGLVFHPLFLAYTDLSQEVVYPALDSVAAVRAWQWGSAALLIAPQSILLGMTFPLMSGGYLRVAPMADGEILGGLYFTNSLGAAFGALFATFVLLPWVGMPGAVATAGVVNLAVGLLAWAVSRRADAQPPGPTAAAPAPTAAGQADAAGNRAGFYRMMLLAALLTGATSFVYEIGWVRMLNQALGTTVHSFELMLAAFILGLAFGGLWVRRRSQRVRDPASYAGHAQVLKGLMALLSIPVFAQSFHWVGLLVNNLPKTEAGYTLFSLGSGGIALAVMFPAAFFAGMTLPLFTMALLRKGAGEASIGRIYAANTLGAILGVFLAVHVLIPAMGLRLAVTLAALVDIALGMWLLMTVVRTTASGRILTLGASSALVVILSLYLGGVDPRSLASGVFRHGNATLAEGSEVHFLRDGKTATVAFVARSTIGIISTNGKPDASIQMLYGGDPTDDEITMAMAAALPLALHPRPDEIANIGWGSGMTTHILLGSELPKRVDSIEIEKAMIDGAANFGTRVGRAYRDPRSVMHIDDARTYFSTGRRRYDVIISEPSNPWVSGVSSLFTKEFYGFLRGHLKQGGMLVQWMQLYELDDELLTTMLAALLSEFPHVQAYTTNGADMLFVASEQPLGELDVDRLTSYEPLKDELSRLGLGNRGDFIVRQVGNRDALLAINALYGAVAHSDFYPTVALQAPKARFMGQSVQSLRTLSYAGLPVLEFTSAIRPAHASDRVTPGSDRAGANEYWIANAVVGALRGESTEHLYALEPQVGQQVALLLELSAKAQLSDSDFDRWLTAAVVASDYSLRFLPPEDHVAAWLEPKWIMASSSGREDLAAVLEAYAATASRDGARMEQAGLAALKELGPRRPPAAREQMLVISILGAIARGDLDRAEAIEREYGGSVPSVSHYGFVRAYLLAWIDVQRQKRQQGQGG
ncbi:spermine synthase [Arenimonas fontis]|uniref:Spermine synthase n=1 Tax=Arenimonas fontis TaxID=2608255 RepID=A0A5B2ZCC0_9GAMM|nr:spermine synthase [Arenimonas fontis]KAA2284920.1 spermine synthase [Arenimonas fontis]